MLGMEFCYPLFKIMNIPQLKQALVRMNLLFELKNYYAYTLRLQKYCTT